VEARQALEAAGVDEGRAGDHDVDRSRGEEFFHATDLGARDDLTAVGEERQGALDPDADVR
jgi:hypothetical protein